MNSFKIQDFPNRFSELGIRNGDTILVHNSLLSFGIPSDGKISEVPSAIFQYLKNAIGTKGTITVPTFNFNFCKGVPFNRQETPSQNMGVFSEFVRKLPQAKRSHHPMQSIAVVGSNTNFIIKNDTKSSFSPNGPFDRLKELNGKILLLGIDINSVSMIHRVEEKYEVPYRSWKTFSGTYIDNGDISKKTYKMFARSLKKNPMLKLHRIEEELKTKNKWKEAVIGGGLIKVFEIKDFLKVAENYIQHNPYYFVSNHPNFEQL